MAADLVKGKWTARDRTRFRKGAREALETALNQIELAADPASWELRSSAVNYPRARPDGSFWEPHSRGFTFTLTVNGGADVMQEPGDGAGE